MGRSISDIISGNGVPDVVYNEDDFSLESILHFAQNRGRRIFAEGIKNNTTAKRYKLHTQTKNVIDNLEKGPVSAGGMKDRDMVKAGRILRDIIEEKFFDYQKNDFRNTPGSPPVVYIEPRTETVYIEYNDQYLFRPSLMNAWGGSRIGRTRIGKGLKDIYGFFAKGVGTTPKKVVGFWTLTTDRFNSLTDGPIVGNINPQKGTDFVVESIAEFFNDPWVKQWKNIQVVIPSAWTKKKTIYFSNNNTGALGAQSGDF